MIDQHGRKLTVGLGLVALFVASAAQAEVTVELQGGLVWNAPSPLLVSQDGHPDLRFDAEFSTEALEIPFYWALRATWWRGDVGWALDLNHHKLHIQGAPPEIQRFTISHGYNHLTFQVLRRAGLLHGFLGLGVVLAHPENIVRGRVFPETGGWRNGEYLAGPVLMLGGGAQVGLLGPIFGVGEVRFTASSIDAPIEAGEFSLRHQAVHGTLGIGTRF